MALYEALSGARMHAAYYRPGGVAFYFPPYLLEDIHSLLRTFPEFMNRLEGAITENPI
jgi:NADH-quinone oxidoreductase subunit D